MKFLRATALIFLAQGISSCSLSETFSIQSAIIESEALLDPHDRIRILRPKYDRWSAINIKIASGQKLLTSYGTVARSIEISKCTQPYAILYVGDVDSPKRSDKKLKARSFGQVISYVPAFVLSKADNICVRLILVEYYVWKVQSNRVLLQKGPL